MISSACDLGLGSQNLAYPEIFPNTTFMLSFMTVTVIVSEKSLTFAAFFKTFQKHLSLWPWWEVNQTGVVLSALPKYLCARFLAVIKATEQMSMVEFIKIFHQPLWQWPWMKATWCALKGFATKHNCTKFCDCNNSYYPFHEILAAHSIWENVIVYIFGIDDCYSGCWRQRVISWTHGVVYSVLILLYVFVSMWIRAKMRNSQLLKKNQLSTGGRHFLFMQMGK